MRLHAIFCVLQLVLVITSSVYGIVGWNYVNYHFGFATDNKITAWGNILDALCRGLLYGYMGYLMTTLSAPLDPRRSQNVVFLLQSGSSFNIVDDPNQAKGLETIKVIIGQFLTVLREPQE